MKNIYSNIYKPTNNNLSKAKIAIEKGSNLAKDIKLREFLIDNTTGTNKTELDKIEKWSMLLG